jgi:hypothetical protein
MGNYGLPPLLLLKAYKWLTANGTDVLYGNMVTNNPHWNRPPDRTKPKSDGAEWKHHDPDGECADGIHLLCQIVKEGSTLVVMPGEGGHHYLTLTKIKVAPEKTISRAKREEILLTAFANFPSVVKTIIDETFTAPGSVVTLNWGDYVKSFGVTVRDTASYSYFRVPVGTMPKQHSLGGLLDHGTLDYEEVEGERWLVIWRKGLGHQKALNTPGTSMSDAVNIAAGGASWLLADKFARALIYGEGVKEANALSKKLSTRFIKWQNFLGGITSRTTQPVSAFTYGHTGETALLLYLCVLFALLLVIGTCIEEDDEAESESNRRFVELLMNE